MKSFKPQKLRYCKCCQEPFKTTRTDKFFVDAAHQKRYNNAVQNKKRDKHLSLTKRHIKTYRILQSVLKNQPKITMSMDFLEGKGADLTLFTGSDFIDGMKTVILFDLALIPHDTSVTIKQL